MSDQSSYLRQEIRHYGYGIVANQDQIEITVGFYELVIIDGLRTKETSQFVGFFNVSPENLVDD